MRAPRDRDGNWERGLVRYFLSYGIRVKWDAVAKRFTGISNMCIARRSPFKEEAVWQRMPEYIRRYESNNSGNVVVIVANRQYGDSMDDALVVTRLGTFIPMLSAMVTNDPERWQK